MTRQQLDNLLIEHQKNPNDQDIIKAIEEADTSKITNMDCLLQFYYDFNLNIGSWDLSSVTSMKGMFSGATKFNQPLDNWDVSQVTDMCSMFQSTKNFNQNIGNWNVSSVRDMESMFFKAFAFNQDISDWNVSQVEDFRSIFEYAKSFNQDLSLWQTCNVKKDDVIDYANNTSFIKHDLTKEDIIKVLQDRKPALFSSNKDNFEALKDYKQLVDRISDYANNHNIDLKSLVLRDLSLDSK